MQYAHTYTVVVLIPLSKCLIIEYACRIKVCRFFLTAIENVILSWSHDHTFLARWRLLTAPQPVQHPCNTMEFCKAECNCAINRMLILASNKKTANNNNKKKLLIKKALLWYVPLFCPMFPKTSYFCHFWRSTAFATHWCQLSDCIAV